MCGIVGYFGKDAAPVLLEGLQRLEYRGYDSVGIAVLTAAGGLPSVVKCDRKVADLARQLGDSMPSGKVGIGHTRWATHGSPTTLNAHPHCDCDGTTVVVHNGIIENFSELRAELEAAGHVFRSQTDSEVVPHLVEACYEGDLLSAVRRALSRLQGSYALAICSAKEPGVLIGARMNAPLVLGLAGDELILASDMTAVIPHTRRVVVLDEGELVVLNECGATISKLDGSSVQPTVIEVDWDVSQAEKGGFAHFMLKEIHETAEAAASALRNGLKAGGEVRFPELRLDAARLERIREVRLLGMGTSLHAAMFGEHIVEECAGITARAEDASEFRERVVGVDDQTLTVVITQSGETADTLLGMRRALAAGSPTVAITNVVGSTAARDADGVIFLGCGPEIGVASTKTFVAHLVTQALLAMWLGARTGRLTPGRAAQLRAELRSVEAGVRAALRMEPVIRDLARRYSGYRHFLYMGRGINHAVALEGALKLKEISYVHAEGISAGGLKHGPIALLDAGFPVLALCTDPATRVKTVSGVHEVAARGAPVLALVAEGDRSLDGVATDLLELPCSSPIAVAVVGSVALQLFAYHVAVALGCEIDQPRNLAKSVTVE